MYNIIVLLFSQAQVDELLFCGAHKLDFLIFQSKGIFQAVEHKRGCLSECPS